jgi:hypothetical protein
VPQLSADIPPSLKVALDQKAAQSGRSISAVVTEVLARYLEHPIHTVFQVSISGALVAGVYDREVSVQAILEHGNFGLGTFADLDGEMVIFDGRVYQVQGSGACRRRPMMPARPLRSSPRSNPIPTCRSRRSADSRISKSATTSSAVPATSSYPPNRRALQAGQDPRGEPASAGNAAGRCHQGAKRVRLRRY